jgi:hypothetical protein
MAEGSSFQGHVIRGTCAEGAHLGQFTVVTELENWSCLEFKDLSLSVESVPDVSAVV